MAIPTETPDVIGMSPATKTDSSTPAVRLEGVRKQYGDDVVAVDDIDLDVRDGEFFSMLGP